MNIAQASISVLETPVALPYTAAGSAVSSNWHILARLRTDDGAEGIGWVVANRGRLVRAMAASAAELGQLLVGMNVLEHEAAYRRMARAANWVGPGGLATMAMSALDIALWDAAGKTLGAPLFRLLGGASDRAPAYASDGLWYSMPIADLQESARAHIAAGYDKIKLRLGAGGSPAAEAERVRAVREAAGPNAGIMVDGTESWDEAQAAATGRALQDAGIIWLEDPVDHRRIDGLARLAAMLDVPVAAGERLYGLDPFRRTLAARAVDVAIIDVARAGGITPWMKIAALAEAHGVPVAGHVVPEVHTHLLAAIPNASLVEYMPRSEPLFRTRLALENGCLVAPTAPGLGVELDEDAVRRYQVG